MKEKIKKNISHSRLTRMARNHKLSFSLMMILMALMLQSNTGGCCSTPEPPEQTPTSVGTLYLPKLQPANPPFQNPACNGNSSPANIFALNVPNLGTIYPLDVDAASATTFWFKVKITSVDGCYVNTVRVNPNERTSLSGKGIKVNYPTTKPYIVEVWAQVCGTCTPCWFLPGETASPEWYCNFANDDNSSQLFGDNTTNNPFNITYHPFVTTAITFAVNNGGNGNGSILAKFKYNGNVPFGTNVLN